LKGGLQKSLVKTNNREAQETIINIAYHNSNSANELSNSVRATRICQEKRTQNFSSDKTDLA